MANKITKAQMFEMIKALDEVKANPDMVAFIDHEMELLSKKATNKKATKTQEINATIKDEILATLTDVPLRVTEIINVNPNFADMTPQKMSALVNQLVDSGEVTKVVDKRVSRFFLTGAV